MEQIGSFDEVMEGVDEDVLDDEGELVEEKDEEEEGEEEEPEEEEAEEGDEDVEGDIDEKEGGDDDDEDDEVQEGDDEGEGKEGEGKEGEPEGKEAELKALHKVTVDGEDSEVTTEDLLRDYQTNQASQKRFREAASIREEASSFFQAILESPGEALTNYLASKQTGGDRVKAREAVKAEFLKWLEPEIRESMIEDEKEREIHRLKRELDDREKSHRQTAEERHRETALRAEQEFVADLKTEIGSNLVKQELPDEEVLTRRVLMELDAYRRAGASNPEIRRLVPTAVKAVAEERLSEAKALMKTLSPDELRKLFPEQAEALTKAKVARVKDARSKKKTKTVGTKKRRRRQEPRFISTRDI